MAKKYAFEMEAYGVALTADQWSAVHDVFENYNESSNPDDEFTMDNSAMNGLVSEILVALNLADGEKH